MPSSLPPLLSSADLPDAELQTAALDGDVFRLDRVFCSVAEFDVPWRRASVFAPSGSLVVARHSAAWVWGARGAAPRVHEVFRDGPGKNSHDPEGFHVSATSVDPSDLVDFGAPGAPVRVTSPTRTVVDLCRADHFDAFTQTVVRRLASEHRVERAGCNVVLDRARSLPHRNRARSRLDALGLVLPAG
jgi:hypothetical protein